MKKPFKYLFYLLLIPIIIVGLYFLIAYMFTFFPKKITIQAEQQDEIHLLYSNIHSDIVFDIADINLSNLPEFKEKKNGYLAFGWGDKETYLNTPNINDIKISTSLKAFFISTPSLMHVSYVSNIFRYQNIKNIKLSSSQKQHLLKSIMSSFQAQKKVYQGYGKEDFFYNAKGDYNLVNTCNTWTGKELRDANISMPYWTPFVWSVLNALP